MASTPYHITTLLEKMTSSDKDYRFMACNDLIAELKKDVLKLDEDAEKRVAQMLLKLLQDKNGEVQNLAVKCLGLLIHKSKETNLFWLNDTLCDNLTSKEEQLRDISSIAIKTIIAELPPPSNSLSARISHTLVKRLLNIFKDPSVDSHVQLESLDIISDLLIRYGNLLQSQHEEVLDVSLSLLKNSRVAVRKRSIVVISQLVTCCSQEVFLKLLDYVISRLSEADSVLMYKTYVQAMGAITRQAGIRISDLLPKIIPLVLSPCAEDSGFKDDELRECCLQTLESFIQKCPRDINQFIPDITGIALRYLSHDPNYYDDGDEKATGSDDEVMDTDQEVDSGDEYNNDDDYSDDDDVSWKVRRAAAKCISAIISSRPDMLAEQYTSLSPALIKRFKEREDNVKSDIFEAYIMLLKQTKAFSIMRCRDVIMDSNDMETDGPILLLQQQVPDLVRGVTKQIKQKSDKTRQCCFSLLTELVLTLPGSLSSTEDLNKIIPALNSSIHDKNAASNLKIDILHFLHVLLCNHSPACFHPHVYILCPLLVDTIQDSFYKITSEALLVTQQLVIVLRPELTQTQDFAFEPFIDPLYQSTLLRLKATDIDQEVKERAIACTAQIIATLGDKISTDQLNECLCILLDRLENEITRLTTVKSLSTIAVSALNVDISSILPQTFPLLASFLRKNQRTLKIATLNCLTILFEKYSSLIPEDLYCPVLKELSPLISEDDLHISQLVLILLGCLGKEIPSSMNFLHDSLLPRILFLLSSPLLQGAAQTALLNFFICLVRANIPSLTYESLVVLVTQPINNPPKDPAQPLHKHGFHSIAKCVSALVSAVPDRTDGTVKSLVAIISNTTSTDQQRLYALLTIGEIGKYYNMSAYGELQQILIGTFNLTSEDVKSAAAYALGNISAGNVEQFVPYLLSQIQANPQHGYLLLQSLKEVIISLSRHPDDFVKLKPCVEEIWSHMFQNCESPEEGKRQVVAECIGKLTLLDINDRLPKLEAALKSESENVRATVVAAFKFTITEQPQTFDPLLKANIGTFLCMLEDPVLSVRRVALIALNSAAHNKPSLIKDMLGFLLPKLYAETNVRKELIRQVEMGPFKHRVDDGLDMRKAAFECMYTMLDTCLDRLDIFEFLTHLEKGLKDHYDIKMLTYLMLTRLSSLCPAAILARLDQLIEGLRATILSNVKPESVKQEYEKQLELKRSAIRALVNILHIQDAIKNPKLNDFLAQIKADKNLNIILESVMHDTKSLTGESMDTS